MAATRADSKKAKAKETEDATSQPAPTAPEGKADTGVPPTAPEDKQADDEQDAPTDPSGHTDEDIVAAVEANPDAPEEELDTEYLPGGEVPVSAPGTEGIARA